MADQEFSIRADKVKTLPDGNDKYAIIGYFKELQRKEREALQNATTATDPVVASEQDGGMARNSRNGSRWRTIPSISSLSYKVTITNWLLALIALILFVQLVRK